MLQPEPGIEIYVPCCGSRGLLVKYEVSREERAWGGNSAKVAPLKHHGQENVPETWAIANMIIHGLGDVVETAATFKNPRYRNSQGRLQPYGHVIANSLWNQHGLPKPIRNQIPKTVCATKVWENYFPMFDQLKWP